MILLLETIHDDAVEILSEVGPVELAPHPTEFEPSGYLDARAIVTRGLGRVTDTLMEELPGLQVVARCGAGLDNVDTAAAAASDIAVVHAPGLTTAAVAEHAVMLMLAVSRRLCVVDAQVKAGNWGIREGFVGSELFGKRLGIVGFGAIGQRIGELGRALGMEVVFSSRRRVDLGKDAVFEQVDFVELVRTSNVIQVCVPLTDATRSMIGADQFAQMLPTAVMINTARGQVVDHVALGRALHAGELAGYGSDLWDPEPPATDDAALMHESTIITPHVAGLTDVTYRAICVGPARAVADILDGRTPDPAYVYGASR